MTSPNAPPSSDNALWRIPEWFPSLDPTKLAALKEYHSELLRFNNKINLISKNTERESDSEHFADSLLAVEILIKQKLDSDVYDIGAGNGFPGIVLACMSPSLKVHLVESDLRKSEFMKHVAGQLKLTNVRFMNVRVESLAAENIKCAISRGFASISRTLLTCNKILPVGGRFYHLKGRSWSSEIAELPSQLIAQWKPEHIGDYTIPKSEVRRSIVLTTKIR